LHSSTLSGGYKNQCKQMWTFPEIFICGKKYVFSTVTSLILFYAVQVKLRFTLRFITAYYECKR